MWCSNEPSKEFDVKKRNLFWLALTLFSMLSFSLFAQFAGGSGTPQDPWQVATAGQLNQVRNYLESCFIQTADIDLGVAPYNEGEGWKPIGKPYRQPYFGPSFQGVYNGNGHSITGLYINRPEVDNQGLFGFSNGTIKNLGLEEIDVKGFENIGGLVGLNEGSIVNCHSKGIVAGEWYVGGLVGFNEGSINSSYSTVDVTGGDRVGGLMGFNQGYMNNCHATGDVNGFSVVGGLVGFNDGVSIQNCHSSGNVTGHSHTGGFIGLNQHGDIINCHSTGNVLGEYYIGGLVGNNYQGAIRECYNTGIIRGTSWVGGLVGYNVFGNISNSYNAKAVTASDMAGGLAGYNEASDINNCHNTRGIYSVDRSGGLVGFLLNGTIINSYNTGRISGHRIVGGLVAVIEGGSITSSYNSADVSGTRRIGGLVGESNGSSIDNCYCTGCVWGYEFVGGLLAWNSYTSTVSNCYCNGEVTGEIGIGGLIGLNINDFSSIVHSYWDIQKSGQTRSGGGEGRLTAQMQFPHSNNTYVAWDWEIWAPDVDQTRNNGYPYLKYFYGEVGNHDLVEPIPEACISAYPQPASQKPAISVKNELGEDLSYTIYNIRGQKLYSAKIPYFIKEQIFELPGEAWKLMPNGVYLLTLEKGNRKIASTRLVVLK